MKFFVVSTALIFSYSASALDGFECQRSDGQAFLSAEFTSDTRATVQEVEDDLGFAITSDYIRNVYSGKPLYAVTTFNFDNSGVLDVIEVDAIIIGLLRFSTDSVPSFYYCEAIEP